MPPLCPIFGWAFVQPRGMLHLSSSVSGDAPRRLLWGMAAQHRYPTMIPALWPHPILKDYWMSGLHRDEGATQPHVQALLYQLILSLNAKHVLELGVWKGATSRWLACAIESNGGGTLTLVDNNPENLHTAVVRVHALGLGHVEVVDIPMPTLAYLESLPTTPSTELPYAPELIFLDDDKQQITEKLSLLKIRSAGAFVCIHDAETLPNEILVESNIMVLPTPHEPSSGHLGLVRL